jgi:hypothetical protein
VFALASLLAGCSAPSARPAASPTSSIPTPIVAPAATPVPALLLLGSSQDSPLGVALADWVEERGWTLAEGDTADVPGLGAVVAVRPEAGTAESWSPIPGLAVVVVDPRGIAPGGSLSTIGGSIRRDQAGFLAGVLAGLASESGWVGRIDGEAGEASAVYQASFEHGLRYGCPRCRMLSLAPDEATADRFLASGVDVVWAVPGPEAAPRLTSLAERGLRVVWAVDPPADAPREQVVGGVRFVPEVLVTRALDSILAGEPASDWPYDLSGGGLQPVEVNDAAVSPGRQRLLVEAVEGLATGALDTGVDPQTGEER